MMATESTFFGKTCFFGFVFAGIVSEIIEGVIKISQILFYLICYGVYKLTETKSNKKPR